MRINMEATIVDLRYKMKDVLEALERRETVQILYHGKVKGKIVPVSPNQELRIENHPFFGMMKGLKGNVAEIMSALRAERYDAF
jgi:antitoxin (DNA-binding transcriptional repressor) of toxin-antitoxin stability system